MNKRLTAVILLALIFAACSMISTSLSGHASIVPPPQTQWTSTYNALDGSSIVQASDSGFLVLGKAAIYSDNQAGTILKVDAFGTQEWIRNVQSFGQNMYLAEASDGGFAVATTSIYTVSGQDQAYTVFSFCLSKFDNEGNTLWNQTYTDSVRSLTLFSLSSTADGGFVLGGDAHYYDPVTLTTTQDDVIVLKTDAQGNMLWNRTYGGPGYEVLKVITQTSDGGYAITAYSDSFLNNQNIWLIKTDPNGNIQWNKFYTSADLNQQRSIFASGGFETKDNGFLIYGTSSDYSTLGNDRYEGFLLKTDSGGNPQWIQTYPNEVDYALQAQDEGYMLLATRYPAGTTELVQTDNAGAVQWNTTYPIAAANIKPIIQSSDGGLALTGESSNKLCIMKTTPLQKTQTVQLPNPKPFAVANASAIWQRYFDGTDCRAITSTSDGGYALAGETAILQSTNLGPQKINYSSVLIKTDASGTIVFRMDLPIGDAISQDNTPFHTINSVDVVMSFIFQTADGGYVVAGTTTIHRNSGSYANFCAAKTDPLGNLLWARQYDFRDGLSAFTQTLDGGFLMAGASGYMSSEGTHIVKTHSGGEVQWSVNLSLTSAAQIMPTADGGYTVLGSTYTYASGSSSGGAKILHLGPEGAVEWTNSLSGFSPQSGILSKDGGYVIAGLSNPQKFPSSSALLKLDSLGNISWYNLYDTIYYPRSLIASQEGGYVFAATTQNARCLVTVDGNGNLQKVLTLDTLWTSYSDNSLHVVETADGNYVYAGKYVGLNTTEFDRIWLAKINISAQIPQPSPSVPEITPIILLVVFAVVSAIVVFISKNPRVR
jgi:hypothetical protein